MSLTARVTPPKELIGLSSLKDNPGSKSQAKRLGRGPGSGKGKTSGRGHKGQKSRAGNGKPTPGFEGGQTPIMQRFPKRGFTNVHGKDYTEINLDQLGRWIDTGRIDPTQKITMRELKVAGLVKGVKDGVKLLGNGSSGFQHKIEIEVSRASQKAMKQIERKGGKVTCVYYNSVGLQSILSPSRFFIQPKLALPTKKRDIAWYSDPKNRGFLATEQEASSSA
ncbi:ribosomal protein L15 [Basidiobolus meristosporus CBS 931.73]|uniref:Ribosomal protein L15 n=1 Tax=Basidiobolus meristosporus CBS 931.73 TaxID=1314790 RepID=A0A1Y1YE04_9FUNG|nr:ribosomal protein L15 [Basidiobolus meristosporus CBS 931.73]|eukprot:ORX96219.1 ribosomal protein L15 [Basidiobolus meristosporus CBS 931.73]